MNKIERHKQICDSLNEMYIKKNHDYGDSVHDTYEKYGITSFLVRMEDKLNRARTLSQKEAKVEDEKITDTLLDLANYAILAILELDKVNYMSEHTKVVTSETECKLTQLKQKLIKDKEKLEKCQAKIKR